LTGRRFARLRAADLPASGFSFILYGILFNTDMRFYSLTSYFMSAHDDGPMLQALISLS
jgi:hypothetical protein